VPMAFGAQNSAAQGDDVCYNHSPPLSCTRTPAVAFSCKDYGADAGGRGRDRLRARGAARAGRGQQLCRSGVVVGLHRPDIPGCAGAGAGPFPAFPRGGGNTHLSGPGRVLDRPGASGRGRWRRRPDRL
jgi:hypothetical protein